MARALAVVAHPDDESWAMGRTIAWLADRGWRVDVLVMTAGEAAFESGADASVRLRELDAAAARLGVTRVYRGHFPDGEVARHREEAYDVIGSLTDGSATTEALDPATLLLSMDEDGGYGHVDHRATTDCARRVAAVLPDVGLYEVAFPRDLLAPVRKKLRRAAPDLVAGSVGPLGRLRADVDLVLDVTETAGRAWEALAAHRSQLAGRPARDFLVDGLADALGTEAWWMHVAGPPALAEAVP